MTWLTTAAVAAYRCVRSMRGNAPVAGASTARTAARYVRHAGVWYVASTPSGIPNTRNTNAPHATTVGIAGKGREDIDVIGEHYLHLAREWGWNDTEVRDAMYVETKQRGWCRE